MDSNVDNWNFQINFSNFYSASPLLIFLNILGEDNTSSSNMFSLVYVTLHTRTTLWIYSACTAMQNNLPPTNTIFTIYLGGRDVSS